MYLAAVPADFTGLIRPAGATTDIGAYELMTAPGSTTVTCKVTLTISGSSVTSSGMQCQ